MKTQCLSFLTSLFIIGFSLTALNEAAYFELNEYVGEYLYDGFSPVFVTEEDEVASVLITQEDGELYAKASGRPKIKIEPSEDTVDVYVNETIGSTGVTFTFERVSNEVKSLTLELDGANFTCQKTEE